MARAALGWLAAALNRKAALLEGSAQRHEAGEHIPAGYIEALRRALEAEGCRFIMSGTFKGGVVPPAPKPIEDRSGGNPLMPRR